MTDYLDPKARTVIGLDVADVDGSVIWVLCPCGGTNLHPCEHLLEIARGEFDHGEDVLKR